MMLTTTEAAGRLKMTPRSVSRLCKPGTKYGITARKATPDELAALLADGRIKAAPPGGVLLIDEAEVERYQRERRPAHRPAQKDEEPEHE